MKYKLNARGQALRDTWEENYRVENDALGGNSAEGVYAEGWCIIDNDHYLRTIEDECGLLLFGYEDEGALYQAEEWIEMYGPGEPIFVDAADRIYTAGDIRRELLKYFEPDAHPFLDDEEKMIDFRALTKEEFLESYSYLTEAEYDATAEALVQAEKPVEKYWVCGTNDMGSTWYLSTPDAASCTLWTGAPADLRAVFDTREAAKAKCNALDHHFRFGSTRHYVVPFNAKEV